MNEELEQRIVDSLDKVAQYVEATETFAAEQAPLVVEEIIRWGWIKELPEVVVLFCLGIALAVASFIVYSKYKKKDVKAMTGDQVFGWHAGFWGPMATALLVWGIMIVELFDVARPLIAPRLYVIEVLRRML